MLTADSDNPKGLESSGVPCLGRPGQGGHLLSEWGRAQRRHGGLHGVAVDEVGDAVHLKGRVASQYLKQVALAVACQIAGPRPVVNEIKVDVARRRRQASAGDDLPAAD